VCLFVCWFGWEGKTFDGRECRNSTREGL
jgi:hypothetical protein